MSEDELSEEEVFWELLQDLFDLSSDELAIPRLIYTISTRLFFKFNDDYSDSDTLIPQDDSSITPNEKDKWRFSRSFLDHACNFIHEGRKIPSKVAERLLELHDIPIKSYISIQVSYKKRIPRIVCALFDRDLEHVLAVQDVSSGNYSLPGGKFHQNESVLDACIREIKEELDITINSDMVLDYDYSDKKTYIEYVVPVHLPITTSDVISIQKKEITKAIWIKLSDVTRTISIDGKNKVGMFRFKEFSRDFPRWVEQFKSKERSKSSSKRDKKPVKKVKNKPKSRQYKKKKTGTLASKLKETEIPSLTTSKTTAPQTTDISFSLAETLKSLPSFRVKYSFSLSKDDKEKIKKTIDKIFP
ncbi:hypothetical protein ADUPG1_012401 [Aduncisulcus paluster]|uniref:Nudix hydrolase domain-containing protein n=1 Tax=Aduncisulcus paluster TaxID=2918883 RepID=A0ABQ5K323_9EUKA|nr:hypothetical protein ADUPG1_012401 [Aduncisulcus paluster]